PCQGGSVAGIPALATQALGHNPRKTVTSRGNAGARVHIDRDGPALSALATPMIFARPLAAFAANRPCGDTRTFDGSSGTGVCQIQQHAAIGIHRSLLSPPSGALAAAIATVITVIRVIWIGI